MNTKLFGLLLSPLSRLEAIAVENNEKLTSIEMLTVDVKNIQSETSTELKKQTTILGDIKKILEERSKDKEKEMAKGAGFKPLSIKETGLAAFMIVGISAAIVASALIFSFIPKVTPMQMLTAALIAATFVFVAPAFVKIAGVLSKMKGETSMDYKGVGMSKVDSSGILPLVAGSLVAMIGISAAIAISSLILQLVMPVHPIKLLTALLIGAAMIGASYAFSKVIENMKGMGVKEVLLATGSLVLISGALVLASIILLATAIPTPMQFLSILLVGLIMIPAAYAFSQILKNIKGLSLKDIGLAAASMVLIAGAIVGISYIFMAYPGDPANLPGLAFTFLAGTAIFIFSLSFALLAKSLKGVAIKDMGKAVISMAFIAVAIIGVAFLFQYLDTVGAYVAPPLEWTLKAGLALVLFSASFIAIAVAAKAIKIKGILMGMIGMAAIAVGILGVAWIFSVLPDAYFAPPLDWTIKTLLTMVLFSVPIAIIGAIASSGAGALAILLGVVGLIVIAAGIWVVAWIFSKIPDVSGVAENLTTALLTPVNKMIDILGRLKNEIGIDNLIPLAGGIVAISGSLLVLGAAVAGMAVGGFAASMANLGSAIADFFSGSETKGPIETLKELISLAPGIEKLPGPLERVANAVSVSDVMQLVDAFGKFGSAVIKVSETGASSSFETTMDRLKDFSKYDFSDQAKDLDAIAKAYNKIADTTNKINVEAMDSTTNMFKALAYLSEQGGKSAIEALGENLIEAVEELANMIANFEGTVKEQSESNSGVAKSIGGFADSFTSSIGSFFGGGSSKEASSSNDQAEVARQMKKLVKMLQSGEAKMIISDVDYNAAAKLS